MLPTQLSTTDLLSTVLPNSSSQANPLHDPLTTPGQSLMGASQANPSIFTVTSLADTVNSNDGVTTLREAIAAANNTPGTDIIQFAPNLAGTITLASATPFQLTGNITIQGLGANVLTINANHLTNPFLIAQGATVNLSGLTIANGASTTLGGGITNLGTLSLNTITLSGNQGGDAGGIDNFGTLTVNRSAIAGNSSGTGGGIDNQGQGVLTVIDSTISGNHANTFGGGILNNGGTATIVNSTISGNSTQLFDGGGIFTQGGTLTITNSTFSGNRATGSGGGIFHFGTALTVTNSTLSGNSAGKTGGGLNDQDSNGVTTSVKSIIHNTVIAGNTATGGSADVFGSFTSQGFNLIGDGTGSNGFTNFVNGDLVGTTALPIDAKLGALQDNGGFTFTMAPLAGSPVIDRGDPINFPITDQRGILRPSGARPDIGAVESVKSLQVDSLADVNNGDYSPGNITLREAILAVGDRGSITFDPLLNGQTLSLTLGPLEINKLLTITGLGANRLTISGNQQSAVFAIANQAQVTIAGLTIANGFSHTDGGGILNHGTLTLINDALSNNHARNGGGIFNDGRLTLMNDTLSGNTATLNGGGLANLGTSTVTHSTLSGNVANGNGGGIWNTGNLSLLSDTVAVNNASRGGGISNTGTTQIKNALIAKNTATQGIDLLGHFTSQGFNLIGIEDGNATGFTNDQNGDQVGTPKRPIHPKLGTL